MARADVKYERSQSHQRPQSPLLPQGIKLGSEGTSRRPAVVFQRQEQLRDRLMLRHLREEAQPLAIDREVACFLAAGRKPVAIKVERGGLQICGVADDAQHRAAAARELPRPELLAGRLSRLVLPG